MSKSLFVLLSHCVCLAVFAITLAGCGKGEERAADVLPDPAQDAAAGADIPTAK